MTLRTLKRSLRIDKIFYAPDHTARVMRQLRLKRKFSQRGLSLLLGKSHEYINDLEKGQRAWSDSTVSEWHAALFQPKPTQGK